MAAASRAFTKSNGNHKVLTCNIRVALPEDDAKGLGWNARREVCVQLIKDQQPDIIGFQEVLKEQSDYLQQQMPKIVCLVLMVPKWMPTQRVIMALPRTQLCG